jgi:hypothetical protein
MSFNARKRRWLAGCVGLFCGAMTQPSMAEGDDAPTPGFPEKIIQWGVQPGETCEDIARALYGGPQHVRLLLRYNRITCTPGAPLKSGVTLVVPAKVTKVPTARITSVNPVTQSRPAGGGWAPAFNGQPLNRNSNVNTRDAGRASIQFVDRSRIYLAEHTLVVIFGTASSTAVSKTLPPVAEVQSGELRAGLSALRGGRAAEVGLAGGGQVSAASRDTVIRKQGKRSTVSVFDGKATVASAGKNVAVPKNFGSAVVEKQAPSKPRPLPPAPGWDAGGSPMVTLAQGDVGTLSARWKAVDKAASYRLEVARDADFTQLVVREEMPADVLAFRGEKIPVGDYWLRVRAIDGGDFLGIASATRAVSLVRAEFGRGDGRLEGSVLEVSPYAVLELNASDRLQLAVGAGEFEAVPDKVDFLTLAPKSLRFRRVGDAEPVVVTVRYVPPGVAIATRAVDGGAHIEATFDELRGVDAVAVIVPQARIVSRDGTTMVALSSSDGRVFTAAMPEGVEVARVDIVDNRGKLLASRIVDLGAPEAVDAPPPSPQPEVPAVGPTLPARPFSPRVDVIAWGPTSRSTAAVGSTVDSGTGNGIGYQGELFAAGGFDALGVDALVRWRGSRGDAVDDVSAWLGGRYRVLATDDLQLATGLRLGFPLSDTGPQPRLEPSIALGAAYDSWSWLANVGGRLRLHDSGAGSDRVFVDPGQAYVIMGGTYDPLDWLRLHSAIDAQGLIDDSFLFRGGLSLGIELGTVVYGSLVGRVSPWNDVGGHVAGQAAIGLRSF